MLGGVGIEGEWVGVGGVEDFFLELLCIFPESVASMLFLLRTT